MRIFTEPARYWMLSIRIRSAQAEAGWLAEYMAEDLEALRIAAVTGNVLGVKALKDRHVDDAEQAEFLAALIAELKRERSDGKR